MKLNTELTDNLKNEIIEATKSVFQEALDITFRENVLILKMSENYDIKYTFNAKTKKFK